MKIFIYRDLDETNEEEAKEVIDILDGVEGAVPYTFEEIRWTDGGMGGIKENYFIAEDGTEWETITGADKLAFKKAIKKTILIRAKEEATAREELTETARNAINSIFDSIISDIENAENEEEIFLADFIFSGGITNV